MTTDREMRRTRPVTEDSYGIPEDGEGMLPWEFVVRAMTGDRNYWVSTTRPDGRPHTRHIWGVWVEGTFHCGGDERTRWARNLAAGSRITVHRESGDEVVIIEGAAERLDEGSADPELIECLDAAYEGKYGIRYRTPFFAVRPRTVLV